MNTSPYLYMMMLHSAGPLQHTHTHSLSLSLASYLSTYKHTVYLTCRARCFCLIHNLFCPHWYSAVFKYHGTYVKVRTAPGTSQFIYFFMIFQMTMHNCSSKQGSKLSMEQECTYIPPLELWVRPPGGNAFKVIKGFKGNWLSFENNASLLFDWLSPAGNQTYWQ